MRKYALSILIPSIPERSKKLAVLHNELVRQYNEFMPNHGVVLGDVEILIDDSKRYLDAGLSIGKKREGLVHKAEGKYLCFLDDDESIAPNYLETLMRLCHLKKDVCTFRNLSKLDNYWTIIDMSLHYKVNEEATPENIVKRRPFHICPVLSKYAKMHPFDDINYGEDWIWMEKVLRHCRTEAKTDVVIHQYNHSSKTSEADNIMRHEKG